jgi:CheY-like chemotaxis protein
MKIQKLLVADASMGFCCALSDKLGGAFDLRICADGMRARELLQSFSPDILVVDLTLPGLDGISLLKAAASLIKRPAMLALTRFSSPYIENALGDLGVDYLMYKPCDMTALTERIFDLSCCGNAEPVVKPKTAVGNILIALEIPINRKGYGYLEAAIELYEKNPTQSITKELYPAVAKLCGGNRLSVERAIRGVIHEAWERRDERVWRLYFRPGYGGIVPRPTNLSFISSLAAMLRRQNADQAM